MPTDRRFSQANQRQRALALRELERLLEAACQSDQYGEVFVKAVVEDGTIQAIRGEMYRRDQQPGRAS